MKKMFTKRLLSYMAIAFLITIGFIFVLQTFMAQNTNTKSAVEKLAQIREKLQSNEAEIEKLVNSLSENNLAKTRAFADILAADKTVLNDSSRIKELCNELMVNELHVIDEDGFITHSSIDSYIGFDMKSGAQSAAFMDIVQDPSIELVQEPQENVIEGTVIQYIGVARKDAAGLVQVGIRPEILEETLSNTKIDVVLRDFDYGENGYIYAVEIETGKIMAHPDRTLIGQNAPEYGLPFAEGKGKAKINGETGYYLTERYNNEMIGVFLPYAEYYRNRGNQTLAVSISMFLIFSILLTVINRTVDNKIVKGVNNLAASVKSIAGGNFDVVVHEDSNPEFIRLSEDINKMVNSIRSSINDNKQLLAKQKKDMENTDIIFENIKAACGELSTVSQKTSASADEIFHGTEQQKQSVDGLNQVMDTLVAELNNSADASVSVTRTTGNAVDAIMDTQKQMYTLEEAIQNISEMSRKIEKIIVEITSIANRTNLLALNASIEAARAGDKGSGFAIVASEIGNLATRSSQAAKETSDLITNSIHAVNEGLTLTKNTMEIFGNVVETIGHANTEVEQIVDMIRKNAEAASLTATEMDKIRNVTNTNTEISEESKQISANMADITKRLLNIVELQ